MLFSIIFLGSALMASASIELTDDNFYRVLPRNEHTLVMIYGSWCKRSKQLVTNYTQVAKKLIRHKPPIKLRLVDCTGETDKICMRLSNGTFPTFKWFHEGQFAGDYHGRIDSNQMAKGLKTVARRFRSPIYCGGEAGKSQNCWKSSSKSKLWEEN